MAGALQTLRIVFRAIAPLPEREAMEKLKIREYVVTEVARNHPTPSMVYTCPKCKVGHKLQHVSGSMENVICQGCGEVYEKP